MSLVLKNLTIFDLESTYFGQKTDVLISEGKVAEIGKFNFDSDEIDFDGQILCPGLFDLHSHFCEPGFEYKEDIASGIATAKAGGFTDVCVLPDTDPVVDNKSQLNLIRKLSAGETPTIHPYAFVSQGGKDEVISELRDLHENGAIGFTGGLLPISHSELLLKSLQYTQSFGGLVVNRPIDVDLSRFGQMHEGEVSTILGMKGIPSISEKVCIERDISILSYAGGRLHITGISSAESLPLIRAAKNKGLALTCDVPIQNLIFSDQDLMDFDSNLKVNPPLRELSDKEALIQGVRDGTIDAISSYHIPQDTESKELEFDLAEFGSINLQTVIPLLLKLQEVVPLEVLFDKFSNGPRRILGLESVKFEIGENARFSIIDPVQSWQFNASSNHSKSRNSVLYGQELFGKASALVVGDEIIRLS